MPRRSKPPYSYSEPASRRSKYNNPPSKKSALMEGLNYTIVAICAGVFMLGIGLGIALSSGQASNSPNIASREVIDRAAPNPEVCIQFGASAIVSDLRVFITLNPFNVYVTQPSMQPGCVLRRNNWSILEKQNLVSNEQVRQCKNRMNTFGFTGPLEASPKIECIYQNDSAGNLFLNRPGTINPSETDNF
ncbi:hypothetical protein Cyast_0356 [Cyanobacterium stanieri PCC 7202]|uniref:DUF3172 domain-containing protein n=1 Tax=Cyanobacterium stanieri (strain ATCC 29140 / PCC 7202) TaxID=292563 RepID=K9YH95_CYASC|nr:hypothetical protein Cyast_0356 [Cyanobacterium stanieri PCC 7202]